MNARLAAVPLAVITALLAAAPAAATTFCVPTFHPACPNSGGNVAEADLETALQADASDGVADKVVVAAGTYSEPDSLNTGGTDPLEIVGAGPAATVLTTTSTANVYVVNLAAGSRSSTTIRDLRIVVPESLPDTLGAGLQATKALIDNVDIEVRNPGSSAASSLIGGGTVRDSRIYATGDGVIQNAITGNAAAAGALTIERTTITGARYGIITTTAAVPVFVRRSTIVEPVFAAVWVRQGGFAVVENSVVATSGGIPLDVTANDAATPIVTLRNSTLVRTGGIDFPAIRVHVTTGTASTNVQVNSVIAHGFQTGYDRQAPESGALGDANLTIAYSNIAAAGTSLGDGTLTMTSNIDADPQFVSPTDYRLRAGSPSIDSGSPTLTDPTVDFDGLARPVDGDGDGDARRDQGAFEFRPPAPPTPGGGGGPAPPPAGPPVADTTAPRISRLRLIRRPTARRHGRLSLTLSERARVVVTLTRVRKGARRRPARQSFAPRAGTRKLRLAKRALAPGRYRLSVVAIDAAGNRSRPARVGLVVRR